VDISKLSHRAHTVGSLPLIRHIVDRLNLDELLIRYVPKKRLGRDVDIPNGRAISALIFNVLLSREPLYGVPDWLRSHALDLIGLEPSECDQLNDDRIGRALDRLYEVEPASLLTAVLTRAVKEFDIQASQIHNDTTSVAFFGDYEGQKDPEEKKRPPYITFGHSKDHRPDLKQLVYSLSITADGAVPVHFKTYDGNTTDDKTHKETWTTLRDLFGDPSFLYVADSKLCTRENMAFIHEQGGKFLTVLPRSRKEDDEFRERLATNTVTWHEVRRKKSKRGLNRKDEVHEAFEPEQSTIEGYRLVWYRSSVKAQIDQKNRARKIKRAKDRIEQLASRTGAHRFRSFDAAQNAVAKVIFEEGTGEWIEVRIIEDTDERIKQVSPGRPGPNTLYQKADEPIIRFEVEDYQEAILADARADGVFAMVTNMAGMTPKELLESYKYQPFLEKRNEQLKSVLNVAPVFLKKPERVAGLLFVYFLAMLVMALLEREIRRQMRLQNIESLPLYPESRKCKAPTIESLSRVFEGIRRTELIDAEGKVVMVFRDPLKPVGYEVLRMMKIDPKPFSG
jgi:transposase